MSDALNRLLAELSTAQPDPARAERIRQACRARLARRAPRPVRPRVGRTPVWQPLVAALGVVYLIAALAQAVAVIGSRF